MDTISAETIKPDLRNILLLGVPFSGKTTTIPTLPEGKKLVFAADRSVERRLAGQKDIDIILCYDTHGEREGSGVERLDKNFKELLSIKTIPYIAVVFDPFNFFYDDQFLQFAGLNRGNTQGAYGDLMMYGHRFLKFAVGLPCYTLIICHTKYGVIDSKKAKDPRGKIVSVPVGESVYHPAVSGSIKNTFAGKFDAVFYTKVIPRPMNTAQYMLRWIPTAEYQCGVKVPIGMEKVLSEDLEPNFTKILEKLKGGKL